MLTFALATKEQKELLHRWLDQDYIRQWLHGAGKQNVLQDLEKLSQGACLFQHWIAFSDGTPFAYLLTSEIRKDSAEDADLALWCQAEGRAITLDLFICEPQFLGKGLAAPLIRTFLQRHFSDVSVVLIHPEASNRRAVHVYEKVGFRIVEEFIASWHPTLHYRMLMKDLKSL